VWATLACCSLLALEPASADLVDGSADAEISGSGLSRGRIGYRVDSAGDVNGDGHVDVITGANTFTNDDNGEGAAFLVYGSAMGIPSASSDTADVLIETNQAHVRVQSAAGVGDVNGDGYDDVIVGSTDYELPSGEKGTAWLFLGGPEGISSGGPADAAVEFTGNSLSHTAMGDVVAGAGDINDDGYDDVLIGDGRTASVFLGGPDGTVTAHASEAHATLTEGDAVDGAGDVNGDGYDDVVAGNFGTVLVYHGGSNGIEDPPTPDTTIEMEEERTLGFRVAGAGDVNGDGYDDIAVTAFGILDDYGQLFLGLEQRNKVFVFHGSADGVEVVAASVLEIEIPQYFFGNSIAGVGDVNADGYDDIAVGASQYNGGESNEGAAFIFLGSSSGIVSGGEEEATAILETDEEGSRMGVSVAGAGDANGDGFADVIAGASYHADGRGAAFVYNGGALVHPTMMVDIDIQPRRAFNSIHPRRKRIPVALFGSKFFDVSEFDWGSIGFGPNAAPPRRRSVVRDLDGDGFDDTILWFRTRQAGVAPDDEEACVEGRLLDGRPFRGCDSIGPPECGGGYEVALVLPAIALIRRKRGRASGLRGRRG
jgi:hypothetical protein